MNEVGLAFSRWPVCIYWHMRSMIVSHAFLYVIVKFSDILMIMPLKWPMQSVLGATK